MIAHAPRVRRLAVTSLAAFTMIARALPLVAQVAPNEKWRTISTEHLRVHFPAALEPLARRAGGEAERAWTRLSAYLAPPRGPVDLVVADNQDFSNGEAGYFPTNRVTIWVRPPLEDPALRFVDDWLQEVVTHELTHVFHLDRTRGLWRAAQYVFGRHSSLFPNANSPRWLTEGIAVAYETKLSGGGRLDGTHLYATLDAAHASGRPLTPGRISFVTPFWPSGDLAYFGGAWLVAEGQRAGGDTAMRAFVDRVGGSLIPFFWDVHAKRSFGSSFTTLARNAAADTMARPAERASIGPAFWDARAPRWRGDSIFFAALGPRNTSAMFVATGNDVDRVDRRNTVDAFGFAGQRTVYGQLEFTDPYRLFSSLYIDGHKLDNTERISSPDVRADGAIVAIETANGGARLVLLDAQGRRVRAFSDEDPDVQYNAPRWSRRGDRIAAIRWTRGGRSDIVLLDTLGRELMSLVPARAVQTHPSWDVDDRAIYFTSDRDGRAAIYRVRLTDVRADALDLVAREPFSLHDAEVSPDGRTLAAFRMSPEGYRLVRIPVPPDAATSPGGMPPPPAMRDTVVLARGPVRGYSPLRTLIPRYWEPKLNTSSRDNRLLGFLTSATDVVGRYSYSVEGSWDSHTGEFYGNGAVNYRGFGRPVVTLFGSQHYTFFDITDTTNTHLGDVTRRERIGSLTLSWLTQRVRSAFSASLTGELEHRTFRSVPPSLGDSLGVPTTPYKYPSVTLGVGWARTSRAVLSIGPEDGVSLSAAFRQRWRTDAAATTRGNSMILSGRAYKSLPLAGHALHSLALRGTYGWAEPQIAQVFSVGGVSGISLEVVPGYTVGDVPRTFFVRGFRPGAVSGTEAWSASVEYRAPLMRVGRGFWPFPLFWQRSAIAFFGDAGGARCASTAQSAGVCPTGGLPWTNIGSVGAEFLVDGTIDYDALNRFRFGVATPVYGKRAGDKNVTFYFSLGLPF